MVEHPSIHDLSAPSFDRSCGGFAAECRLSRRYRSTVAAAVGAQGGSMALSSEYGQYHIDS